jgi:type II secretory pathway component GspD/PulD (secretin)
MIRHAILQLPTKNATIILRNGIVQVTTLSRAAPDGLMQTEVIAVFDQRPLASALRELSESTGVTIVVDPRTAKAETPVTATFANGVPLKTALRLMADMTDQTVVEMEGAIYCLRLP